MLTLRVKLYVKASLRKMFALKVSPNETFVIQPVSAAQNGSVELYDEVDSIFLVGILTPHVWRQLMGIAFQSVVVHLTYLGIFYLVAILGWDAEIHHHTTVPVLGEGVTLYGTTCSGRCFKLNIGIRETYGIITERRLFGVFVNA